jgi:uncharacterized membrane protein YphA (DoxX/SURF4 family)
MNRDSFAKNTLAPLTLRLALAAVFIYHGTDKITGQFNDWGASWAGEYWRVRAKIPAEVGKKLEHLADKAMADGDEKQRDRIRDIRDSIDGLYRRDVEKLPPALEYNAAQLAVAWGELIGGLLLLVGFWSRLAALWLMVIQIGAIYTVTWVRGFSLQEGGGYEYNFVLMAACLAVVFLGSGPLSLSGYFRARRQRAAQQAAAPPPQVPVSV